MKPSVSGLRGFRTEMSGMGPECEDDAGRSDASRVAAAG